MQHGKELNHSALKIFQNYGHIGIWQIWYRATSENLSATIIRPETTGNGNCLHKKQSKKQIMSDRLSLISLRNKLKLTVTLNSETLYRHYAALVQTNLTKL